MKTCANCLHYDAETGSCHLNPPTVTHVFVPAYSAPPPGPNSIRPFFSWPAVGEEDFCGQWRAASKTSRASQGGTHG